jgi:hypothetical protein
VGRRFLRGWRASSETGGVSLRVGFPQMRRVSSGEESFLGGGGFPWRRRVSLKKEGFLDQNFSNLVPYQCLLTVGENVHIVLEPCVARIPS